MRPHHLLSLAGWLVLAWPPAAAAPLKLPALFSDHMVLQAEIAAPVWGWGEPGASVEVSIGGCTKSTTIGADGSWKVLLDTLPVATEPATLTIKSDRTLIVHDVLIGEVWLGTGQSNMSFPVSRSAHIEEYKKNANTPALRLFTVKAGTNKVRQRDCEGRWEVASPATIGSFSAVGYFFGYDLVHRLNRPVGMIDASLGGTCIEAWTATEAMEAVPTLQPILDAYAKVHREFDLARTEQEDRNRLAQWDKASTEAKAAGQPAPRKPGNLVAAHYRSSDLGGLFNGKIAPLIPFGLRGILWYQGEGNATPAKARFYETQLRLLVTDLRQRWGRELPFAWVQLPNLVRVESWVHIRDAQFRALDLPATGMVVTTDLGDARNLHPQEENGIGSRLALWALGTVYGQKDVVPSGPLYTTSEIKGSEVIVHFRYVETNLTAPGGILDGFEVAGADRRWHPAAARIEGRTVVISSPAVPAPLAARYAWKDNPPTSLFNGAGLPASPFRTDDWPLFAK